MRTIKFRAWNKSSKTMVDLLKITPLALSDSMNTQLALQGMSGLFIPFSKEFELMQFTGLHDKNGKEVYEGDILNTKTTFENNMADRRFQPDTERLVSFENGCFTDKYTGRDLWDKIRNITYNPQRWTNYEIIGNIYENPELLQP